MTSDGELTEPPLYLELPPIVMVCCCPLTVLDHCTDVTAGLPLTVHCRVTDPPTMTEYVFESMVAVGRSVNEKEKWLLLCNVTSFVLLH